MSDENSTVREEVEQIEADATDENAEVTEAEDQTEESEETGAEDEIEEQEEQEPEEVEFDLGGGQKVRFKPDATAKEVAEHAQKAFKEVEGNYTRKFQDVADKAKSLEAREKVVEKLSGLNDETLNTYARGLAVRQELEQLAKVDIRALWQSNPDQARQVSDTISAKQAELNGIVNRVSQLEGELSKAQQAEAGRRLEEGKAIVTKHIPDFEAKVLPQLSDYMVQHGLPKEEVANWPMNPLFTRIAHKAMLYDQMQAKAKQAAKPKPQAAKPVTPMRNKGTMGNGAADPSKMSPAQMAKYLGLPG